jgi:long-chain fatty acid transport protein
MLLLDSTHRERLVLRLLVVLALGPLLLASTLMTPARAGGLYSNEFATTSQANAGAGRGAWVPDASAALHNPASMTELDDHGFASGFSLAFGDVHFDASSSSPSGSANGGNQAGIAPIASFSYVHKVSDRVRFGLSFFSLSGSILDPGNGWAGRFEMTEVSLLTISIVPILAVRVTDWLSVGAGPAVSYGVLDWKLRVDDFPAGSGSESKAKFDNLDDWQASGRVGLYLKPLEDVSLSIFYNSKTDFNLKGKFRGPAGALNPGFKLGLPLPQFVEVSAYWQVTDKIALLGTFNWEDWSEADKLRVTLGPGPSVDAAVGFIDTYKIGVGANYRLTDEWLLQTGLSYDTAGLKNKDRTTALPVDEQIRFAVGAQHDLNESLTLGLSFVYLNLGQGEVRNATVRGDYDRNNIFILGMTVAFKELPWSGKATFSGKGI